MLQSFQTCTLIRFQIKKTLIFVQSVSHAFVSMVTICEITCSISCFPVKLNRSLFQNFMERNRKKHKQDFDAIKPELRRYKKIHERYNQKLHHWYCLFFSPLTDRKGQMQESCALQIFIGKVDKAELEIIYNFPEMGNRESLPSNSQFMIYWQYYS